MFILSGAPLLQDSVALISMRPSDLFDAEAFKPEPRRRGRIDPMTACLLRAEYQSDTHGIAQGGGELLRELASRTALNRDPARIAEAHGDFTDPGSELAQGRLRQGLCRRWRKARLRSAVRKG